MSFMVSDVAAIMDHFHLHRAVFAGHDLGALVLWALPFYMPDRVLGCASLNYPLFPFMKINPLWGMRLLFHRRMYMRMF